MIIRRCLIHVYKWRAEWNACYMRGSKRRLYTIKICLCFFDKKKKVCDHLSLWSDLSHQHFYCISKGNKLFWCKRRSSLFYPRKWGWVISAHLWEFLFSSKTSKSWVTLFFFAPYKTGILVFLYSSNKIESTKFQWED